MTIETVRVETLLSLLHQSACGLLKCKDVKRKEFYEKWGNPQFSGIPWPQIWRCWFSSQLLHTWLQNHPSVCSGSQVDEDNRTTSSAESRDSTLRTQNWMLLTPQLHLKIVSMKITSDSLGKAQHQPRTSWRYKQSFYWGYTRTGWLVATSPYPIICSNLHTVTMAQVDNESHHWQAGSW